MVKCLYAAMASLAIRTCEASFLFHLDLEVNG